MNLNLLNIKNYFQSFLFGVLPWSIYEWIWQSYGPIKKCSIFVQMHYLKIGAYSALRISETLNPLGKFSHFLVNKGQLST